VNTVPLAAMLVADHVKSESLSCALESSVFRSY